jgi:hypothetical protein
MNKLYVIEYRPGGEVSTVGLYYSREEAEKVVMLLRAIPEKRSCKYEISDTPPTPPATSRREIY